MIMKFWTKEGFDQIPSESAIVKDGWDLVANISDTGSRS